MKLRRFEKGRETIKLIALYEIRESDGDGGTNLLIFGHFHLWELVRVWEIEEMGRKKVEIKRIEDKSSRQATFSKRRNGLMKKAKQLSVLCDVDVAVLVFSSRGRLFEFSSTNRFFFYLFLANSLLDPYIVLWKF